MESTVFTDVDVWSGDTTFQVFFSSSSSTTCCICYANSVARTTFAQFDSTITTVAGWPFHPGLLCMIVISSHAHHTGILWYPQLPKKIYTVSHHLDSSGLSNFAMKSFNEVAVGVTKGSVNDIIVGTQLHDIKLSFERDYKTTPLGAVRLWRIVH